MIIKFKIFEQVRDNDPYEEELWDYVPYSEWEGSTEDYLINLNNPEINKLLDKIREHDNRNDAIEFIRQINDIIDKDGNISGDDYEMLSSDISFDLHDDIHHPEDPNNVYEDDFQQFWKQYPDYNPGDWSDAEPKLEFRFNGYIGELIHKDQKKYQVYSYFHNHFYNMDLRNEYMERILNKEDPKNVAVDIYNRYTKNRKPTDMLNYLFKHIISH